MSSNKLRDRLMNKTADLADKVASGSRPSIADQAPVTMPGQLGAFRLEAQRYTATIQSLTEQLEAAKANGGLIELRLDVLDEVPGRRRHMPPERFAELRENLRHNQLVHPVVVRHGTEDRYEIVSGHHRIDAFRELSRSTIPGVIVGGSDQEVVDSSFFANLMQSDLTDYEKYVGLKGIQSRRPDATREQLSQQTGVSETAISFLQAFDHLPATVLALCGERPTLLGSAAAFQLASLTKKGKAMEVVAAFTRLAAGEIDQSQAVKLAGAQPTKTKEVHITPVSVKVKQGKSVYCELRRAKNVMRLQFASEAEAERLQAAIQQVLEAGSENKTL